MDLTKNQCAAIAVDLLPMLEKEAAERMARAGASAAPGRPAEKGTEIMPDLSESRDQAGEMLGVSGRYVSDAKRLRAENPELFEEVRAGTKTITAARRPVSPPENGVLKCN